MLLDRALRGALRLIKRGGLSESVPGRKAVAFEAAIAPPQPALILILDDKTTNRNIYARLAGCVEEGASVEVFADPLDALEWLEHNTVDLVVTDFQMPEMNGAEFTRRLRRMPAGADVPVVVVTAYADRSLRERSLAAGATDFLQSPVDHYEFVARARNLIALSRRTAGTEGGQKQGASLPSATVSQVIDALPAMISAADRDGKCLFVNSRQAALAHASSNDLVGRDMAEVIGAERAERGRNGDQFVLESGAQAPNYREEILGDDGISRVLLTTKSALRNGRGGVVGVLTTSLDITGVGAP